MSISDSSKFNSNSAYYLENGGGGASGVTTVTASGAGISATPTSGNVVIANTGVTSLLAGAGISVSAAVGAITIAATGGGASVLVPYSDSLGTGYYINLGSACIFFTRAQSINIAGPTLGNYFCILPPPCRIVGSRGCITALSSPYLTAPLVEEPTTSDALPTVSVDTIGTLGPAKIRLPDGTGVPGSIVTMVGFWSTGVVPA